MNEGNELERKISILNF